MNNIPTQFSHPRSNFVFVLVVTLFVLLFMAVYQPTFDFNEAAMALWAQRYNLCVPILCSIVLVSTLLSRTLLVLCYRRRTMSEREYVIWQCCEWLVICLFSDLFVCLIFPPSFLQLLPKVLLVGLALLIFPYLLFYGYLVRQSYSRVISEQRQRIEELQRRALPADEADRIEFADEKGVVRLVTSQQAVICIVAAGNYVDIIYDDNGRLVRFSLRNTLKGIENICAAHGLLRCHRSYFVNLYKIKLLRRDANGLYAEMNVEGVEDLPVSKNYANEITSAFSKI